MGMLTARKVSGVLPQWLKIYTLGLPSDTETLTVTSPFES